MDFLLDSTGDLHVSKDGNILLKNSVAQKIRIKLLWFEGEWRWNKEKGMPYRESLFVKNPDTDQFESYVREKIFEVEEVTEVKEVAITFNANNRSAAIKFVVLTDFETIAEEVNITWQITE